MSNGRGRSDKELLKNYSILNYSGVYRRHKSLTLTHRTQKFGLYHIPVLRRPKSRSRNKLRISTVLIDWPFSSHRMATMLALKLYTF